MLDLFLKLCYTIIVPRERKRTQPDLPDRDRNVVNERAADRNKPHLQVPCNKNLTKKILDIKHKLCYNEYMKRTRKSP